MISLSKVGGFKLVFDLTRPRMARLELAEVFCSDCPLQFEPLDDKRLYQVGKKDLDAFD